MIGYRFLVTQNPRRNKACPNYVGRCINLLNGVTALQVDNLFLECNQQLRTDNFLLTVDFFSNPQQPPSYVAARAARFDMLQEFVSLVSKFSNATCGTRAGSGVSIPS